MNAKTMAAILEHMDAKSERICMLDEKLRKADEMFRQWKTLLGLSAKLTGPETEEAIKRMSFERTTLETNHKQHVELVNALATCPLQRDAAESNRAYAVRVGDALTDANLQWEQDQRRIAQLEKRESELNALHDTIEALPGFPMQPEEKYAEYLQRLAENRATLDAAASAHRDKIQGTQEEISEWIRQVEQARNQRDKALEAAQTAQTERDHFRAKWDASLKARDSAQDEARRTREANEALQGQLTLRSQIIARVIMDPAADKLFNERDWSDAARKVLIDARALVGDDGKVQA